MKQLLFLIIGFLFLYESSALDSPLNEELVFFCKSYIKDGVESGKTRDFVFQTDTSSVPEKQTCGNSQEECLAKGFKDFISYSFHHGKYINNPILIIKYCTHLDSENFIETRVGLIPHLDKVTLSMRINGEDSQRLWTHSSIKVINHTEPHTTIGLNYKGNYITECTLIPRSISTKTGLPLSYSQTYNQEITQCK